MLQETIGRLDGLASETQTSGAGLLEPLVVCNEAHRFLVAEQFRLMGRAPAAILLEPIGRNTAPALTLAALAAIESGADPVLLVMPADHAIRQESAFCARVADGYRLAQDGYVITFGIVPSKAETGYGYIRQGAALAGASQAFQLQSFVEKPDYETAQGYLACGEYLWNSGIFMLKASLWLALIARFRPAIADAVAAAYRVAGRDGDFVRLAAETFAGCPSESIDYAVMEPVSSEPGDDVPAVLVLPLDVGWSDVGAWSTLWEVSERDSAGNVLEGDAFVHDAANNLLIARHRMLAAVGVQDLVVVETPDAVLVAHKDCAQDVKAVTQFLQQQQRTEYRHHQRVHRPWGAFEGIGSGPRYQVKRLTVNPGESLSSQMHHHRAEHWIVVSGTARVTCDEQCVLLTENQSTYIPVGTRHRLENPGIIPLEIIEVQSGAYLGEDDIVRFHDAYNRSEKEV